MSFKITAESDLFESRGTFTLDRPIVVGRDSRCDVEGARVEKPLMGP
jgi:hypothetical protein